MKNVFWGIIFVTFGVLLLLDNLGVADFGDMLQHYWPLIVIVWGISILMRRPRHGAAPSAPPQPVSSFDSELFHHSNVFGDVSVVASSNTFKGGSVSTIFGETRVDLSGVTLAEGEHFLHIHGVFGDAVIILPRAGAVAISARSTFGSLRILDQWKGAFSSGIETSTPDYASAPARLKISLSTVFGEVRTAAP